VLVAVSQSQKRSPSVTGGDSVAARTWQTPVLRSTSQSALERQPRSGDRVLSSALRCSVHAPKTHRH
jgi:hypothetical protein